MSTEQEPKTLCLGGPIEEPLAVVANEGSSGDSKVENEVKKKKIFFFGQPGCLKHSPIKTNAPENHNNHEESTESSNIPGVVEKLNFDAKSTNPIKESSSDDEDGDNLLMKISEALEDGTNKCPEKEVEAPSTSNFI
jgi:hypothetical protein